MADKSAPVARTAYSQYKTDVAKKLEVLESKLTEVAASIRVVKAAVVA